MKALFLFFLFPFISQASTLLIPDQTISLEKYTAQCQLEGYHCTTKYFIDKELSAATPQLDAFLDSVDFSKKEFIESAQKSIQTILQREMISISQLDMILRLLEQLNSQNLGKPGKLVEEIKFIRQNLIADTNNGSHDHDGEVIIYFKTILPRNKFLKIKPSFLQLPFTVIAFNHVPVRALAADKSATKGLPLILGVCENAKLNHEIEAVSWNVLSEASCGWSKTLAQGTSNAVTTVKENKGWILVGALALGALVLGSQYDVSFQF